MFELSVLLHVAMIIGGLALIIFGFWGSSQLRPPLNGIAALGAPLGLFLSLAGVLLLIIPTFFTKP